MGRTENAVRNVFFGTLGNIIILGLGFVLRTVFIHRLDLSLLGVNGFFTNVLSVLSLAELGIGTAISYSLYKPVADQDYEKIKSLMLLYKQVYRYIALIVTVLGVSLIPFLKYMMKEPGAISNNELILYYLIFLFTSVSSYFVTYKYTLMNAEQKYYLQMNIHVITLFVITTAQIIILILFRNFLFYLLTSATIGLLQKIFVNRYFQRLYPYLQDKNSKPLSKEEKAPIKKNVIALIYHKIGEISINQTDNIIISSFINVTAVGLLSNYNLVITSMLTLINVVFHSVISCFGNLIATESKEKQYQLFLVYRFLGFWIFGFSAIVLYLLLTPFITLWLGEKYRLENSVIGLIMLDCYFKGHRTVLLNFKTAAGVFEADKYIALIQGIVNLIISITLIQILGLKGVFIGTLISGLIANVTRPFLLYKIIFNKKAGLYFKDSILYAILAGAACFILLGFQGIILDRITTINFLLMAVITVMIPNVLFYVFLHRREEYRYLCGVIVVRYGHILKKFGMDKIGAMLSNLQGFVKRRLSPIHRGFGYLRYQMGLIRDICYIKLVKKRTQECKDYGKVAIDREQLLSVFQELRDKVDHRLQASPIENHHQNRGSLLFGRRPQLNSNLSDYFSASNGLMAVSMELAHRLSKDRRDINGILTYYTRWIQYNVPIQKPDHVLNGYTLIYLHQLTQDRKYKYAIDRIRNFLELQPKDKNGSFYYRFDRPHDIYIESIGLVCPFLCRYGRIYKDNAATNLAANHMMNFLRFGFDEATHLPYHGFNLEKGIKCGIIGWGRGIGWFLFGLVESLSQMNTEHTNYDFLCKTFHQIVDTTIKYQLESGYFTWQLTASEGPVDTSSTAMISYAVRRGVMLGLLDNTYLSVSNLGLIALMNSITDGEVTDSFDESMAFGMYPQNYGTYPSAQGPAAALFAIVLKEQSELS
ncbi:glycoside hydrolase family 88 protein [Mobilitalea sibirica]|uniref:Glycoside hydrolase family 88 protein n=1 Tax=Mobilitalea sibirica TaxID=1462919 RepID=A0A8J7H0D8_9FIRM|nr:glycoside hydrolase family 88 protein [Mobilitalea sibirica]MBH1939420.1 glycoside hydrolase family 88 protein [Mobilitalea sibirica]